MDDVVNLPKIRIIPIDAWNFQIFIDDVDISGFTQAIEFKIDYDDPNTLPARVKLTVLGFLDIPENLRAMIEVQEDVRKKG